MIDQIIGIIIDIVGSLRITNLLQVLSLIVVGFLLSSPGVVATVIGISTKLGIYEHITSGDHKKDKE